MAHALSARHEFLREHSPVLTISVLMHAALLVLLTLNLNLMPRRQAVPTRLAIQATVVDARELRAQAAERQRREQAARQAVEERRQREAEQRRAEQQRIAHEQDIALKKRQEAAEARQREEQQHKQAAEEARLAAEREKAARAKAEADARRKAEAERRKAQSRADLARQMAEEEDLMAAADSGELDRYAEVIRQKVERNWIRPASAREGISCVVLVRQIPGGEVVDVQVTECNGDAAVRRSIEAAVLRASPLPPPPDPSLFDRSLRFEFRPRD